MNDKRAALSVAATGLLGVGIALILFTSGAALGWLSITVGILIGARAVAELRRGKGHTTNRSPHGATPHRLRAEPVVGLNDWMIDTPWGTTPWGLATRVSATAAATVLILAIESAGSPTLPVGETATRLVIILAFFALFFIAPWAIERAAKPTYLLSRKLDLAIVIPSGILTIVAGVVATTAAAPEVLVLVVLGVQLLTAASVGIGISAVERRRTMNSIPHESATPRVDEGG